MDIKRPKHKGLVRLRDGGVPLVRGRVTGTALPPKSKALAVELAAVLGSNGPMTNISWQPAKVGRINRKGGAKFVGKSIGSALVSGGTLRLLARASTNFNLATTATNLVELRAR